MKNKKCKVSKELKILDIVDLIDRESTSPGEDLSQISWDIVYIFEVDLFKVTDEAVEILSSNLKYCPADNNLPTEALQSSAYTSVDLHLKKHGYHAEENISKKEFYYCYKLVYLELFKRFLKSDQDIHALACSCTNL